MVVREFVPLEPLKYSWLISRIGADPLSRRSLLRAGLARSPGSAGQVASQVVTGNDW